MTDDFSTKPQSQFLSHLTAAALAQREQERAAGCTIDVRFQAGADFSVLRSVKTGSVLDTVLYKVDNGRGGGACPGSKAARRVVDNTSIQSPIYFHVIMLN